MVLSIPAERRTAADHRPQVCSVCPGLNYRACGVVELENLRIIIRIINVTSLQS